MAESIEASRVGLVFQAIPADGDIAVDVHGDVFPTSLRLEHVATDAIDRINGQIASAFGIPDSMLFGSPTVLTEDQAARTERFAEYVLMEPTLRVAQATDYCHHVNGPVDRRKHRAEAFAARAARIRRLRTYEAVAESSPFVATMVDAAVDELARSR